MNSKVEKRRHSIIDVLKENGHVAITRLAIDFNVSESTIKRDLNALVEGGFIKRTHGGAFLSFDNQEIRIKIPAYSERRLICENEKKQIAQNAAKMIGDGDTIFLDAGSTIDQIVYWITATNVTIYTNSIAVVLSVMNVANAFIVSVLNGVVDFDHLVTRGVQQIELLDNLFFDKVFLSCQQISPELGVMVPGFEEKMIKNKLVKNSQKTILCADSSKIGKLDKIVAMPFEQIDYFITDSRIRLEDRDIIQKSGTVVVSEPSEK